MSDNRTRIWFSLFVLAIFGLGLATGLFMGRRMGPPPRLAGPVVVRGPMAPGGPPQEQLIERLDRVLRLTGDQRARVEAIFEARGGQLEQMQREVVERADQERRTLQHEIRSVLTPQQQARFNRWLQQAPRGLGGRGRGGPPVR